MINNKISTIMKESLFKINHGIDANVEQISKKFSEKPKNFNNLGLK